MKESQIIAQELANAQRGNPAGKAINEDEVYNKLTADFPLEAMQADKSRGFALTSVKAQYVIERLNETFGFMNWTFGGEYKEVDGGIIFMGTLVVSVNGKQNRHFAPGYASTGPKKLLGDVYKSAHTDSLSKCASKFGVANAVFKGLVDANNLGGSTSTKKASKPAPFNTRRKKAAASNDDWE